MLNRFKNLIRLLFVCVIPLLLFSCKPVEIPNPVVEVQEWTKGMVMILVAEEKNSFEKAFTKDVWNLKSEGTNYSYGSYIVENVKEYVKNLMTVNLMLDVSMIEENTEERVKLDEIATEYYNQLTDGDKDFIKCSKEDVFNLYSEYYRATKIVNMLIRGSDDEISVSEAKVIEVEQIKLDTLEEAKELREKVMQRGASFTYFAKQYSKDFKTTYEVQRGSDMATYFPEIFYLNTNEISEILTHDNSYYIFKCTNGYKERETLLRRNDIIKAVRQKAFDSQFEEFKSSHKIYLDSKYWNDIVIDKNNKCTVNNFFTLFEKHFGDMK